MSLTPRHRWCIDKIVQCFSHHEGGIVDDPKVQSFVRKPDVFLQFASLFSCDKGTREILFIHYQVKEIENDENVYSRNFVVKEVCLNLHS